MFASEPWCDTRAPRAAAAIGRPAHPRSAIRRAARSRQPRHVSRCEVPVQARYRECRASPFRSTVNLAHLAFAALICHFEFGRRPGA